MTSIFDAHAHAHRWPLHPLAAIVEKLVVGLPVSRHAAKAGDASVRVPVLSVGDIEDGRVAPLPSIAAVELRVGDFERFRVQTGDVLVSCRGTVLKAAPVLPETAGVLASSNVIMVRPNRSVVVPQIILAILQSPPWQSILRTRTRSSTGLMQLTVKDLEDLPVPVPPLAVQVKLAQLIDAEQSAYRSARAAALMRRELVGSFVTHALLGPRHDEGP